MNKEEKIRQFLILKDFDEYMERYEEFVSMPSSPEIFEKEMKLMETDDQLTHRKKEAVRLKQKQRIVLSLRNEIANLKEELFSKGTWKHILKREPKVKVIYRYPSGKNGDIDHASARRSYRPKQTGETEWTVKIPSADYETVELLCFYKLNLMADYDPFDIEENPAAVFLEKYHRVFQIERRMRMIHLLNEKEFRNLRSVEDAELRRELMKFHDAMAEKRNAVYEHLIMQGEANAKWQSEQTAFAIVKEFYPDAVFQYEARWLGAQKIDIYIPSEMTAIEYQGLQHSEAVDFFGGEEGLKNNRRRDEKKRMLCRKNGVKLLYWKHDDPLESDWFLQNLAPLIGRNED